MGPRQDRQAAVSQMTRPTIVDTPELPEGYIPAPPRHLDWSLVEGWLTESRHYWLSTTRPDGRPHVVPRWGVWLDGAFWYDGSPETRHVRNVESNPGCVLHLESGERVVIVEGLSRASSSVTGDLGSRLAAEYGRKYGPEYAPGPDAWSDEIAGGMRVLAPKRALAWSAFPSDLTRFSFAPRIATR